MMRDTPRNRLCFKDSSNRIDAAYLKGKSANRRGDFLTQDNSSKPRSW